MMTDGQLLITILIAALMTVATRAVSFIIFPKGKDAPRFILWLGRNLPRAVMAMLLVYCLKDLSFGSAVSWVPAVAGVIVTAGLHVWKKRMMLSIGCGTLTYMLLLRLFGAA